MALSSFNIRSGVVHEAAPLRIYHGTEFPPAHMSKQAREAAKDSLRVENNLTHLGNFSRPRTDLNPERHRRESNKGSAPLAFKNNLPKDPIFPSGQATSASYKQYSLTKGTLNWQHQRTGSDTHRDVVRADPKSKSVAFRDSPEAEAARQSTMATVANNDRARSRRERTFIGGQCAACEELLEHTLSGERVLQFSCGHVAHEACFYEYIRDADAQYCPTCDAPLALDSARGGSMLDLSKLSNMVRSFAQQSDIVSPRPSAATPVPWDKPNGRDENVSVFEGQQGVDSQDPKRDSRDSQKARIERYGSISQHSRNNSGNDSVSDHQSQEPGTSARQHVYDVHAMESTVSDEPIKSYRPVNQPPLIMVRSEFPTITRSNHQQTLTCLVTVEVPEARRSLHGAGDAATMATSTHPLHPGPKAASFSFHTALDGFKPVQPLHELNQLTADLRVRVDNWHGLDFARFGTLRLFGSLRIGKDQKLWQELECYLFDEMLICVKEKKNGAGSTLASDGRRLNKCTLKGSILIKRHLQEVQALEERLMLTLNLSVKELPTFHLRFRDRRVMDAWNQAFLDLRRPEHVPEVMPVMVQGEEEPDASGTDDEYDHHNHNVQWNQSNQSSFGGPKSTATAPTEHSTHAMPTSLHTPLDIVVVVPVSSSMQGLKISLLKDALRFIVDSLGERDRMGLVTFGSSQGGVPLVGMTSKRWSGWDTVLSSIRPVGQKSLRADVVDGANVAMDLLMQRQSTNPISTILLISDSSTSDSENVNFVVSRAEAAKVSVYSFGLGLTHKPDRMIELSSRTKGSYLYVKDWMMLRECVAGCLGSLQSISHQNVKLRLRLPEGSPAKFVKISGAMSSTRRATGRDAEATLGDLRFGDKRDILVQLVIESDHASKDQLPQDHWETIVSGLEALGGSLENEDPREQSVEELPLLQADLSFTDFRVDTTTTQHSRPSLLTITMQSAQRKSRQNGRPVTPPIPPHPSIVQRRMELLTSDMLTRALTLVSKQQNDRAYHLLTETRSILKGLAKGGLPPLPAAATPSVASGSSKRLTPPKLPGSPKMVPSNVLLDLPDRSSRAGSDSGTSTSRPMPPSLPSSGIDPAIMNALDADIEAALEWINHPTVFGRDSRKAVLQAIGVIATQRGYTFRNATETIWAERIGGIRTLAGAAGVWHEGEDKIVVEEQ